MSDFVKPPPALFFDCCSRTMNGDGAFGGGDGASKSKKKLISPQDELAPSNLESLLLRKLVEQQL